VSQATVIIDRIRTFLQQDLPYGPLVHRREAWMRELDLMRERADEEVELLVIILFGGTGVGKSTTVNALVGSHVAETSMLRPCTDRFVFYGPPGLDLGFLPLDDVDFVQIPALEHPSMRHVLLVDAPDCDSIHESNLAALEQMLPYADVFLTVGTHLGGKYKIEALFDVLRRYRHSRQFLFFYNQRDFEDEESSRLVMEDWRRTLIAEGIEEPVMFKANALAVCTAQKENRPVSESDSRDLQALREWIFERIRSEDVRLIKRGNVFGALEQLMEEMTTAVSSMDVAATQFEEELVRHRDELAGQWYRRVRQRVQLRWRSIFRGQLINTLSQESFGFFGTAMRLGTFYSLVGLIPWHLMRMARGRWLAAGALAREGGRALAQWRNRMDTGSGEFEDLYGGFFKTLEDRGEQLRLCLKEHDMTTGEASAAGRQLQEEADLTPFTHKFPQLWNAAIESTADRLRMLLCNFLVQILFNIPPLAIVGWTAWGSFSKFVHNDSLSMEYYVTALVLLCAVLFCELWLFRSLASLIGRGLVLKRLRNARGELSESLFQTKADQVTLARGLVRELGRIRSELDQVWKRGDRNSEARGPRQEVRGGWS